MAGKPKHIPQRTCVGCRAILAKRALIRVVRRPDAGVVVDPSGKLAGRGAYLHNQKSCWERGLKGGLANALKTTLTSEDRQRLEEFMSSLPEDSADTLTGTSPLTGTSTVTGKSTLQGTGEAEVLNA
ncbi:MAG: YlxR family protein [Anaerolineales bacterium]